MKAVRVHKPGGPEVLRLEDVEAPEPGESQVLIKVEVAGVNYADTGVLRGIRFGPHQAEMPLTPGFEAAGTVAALGEGVEGLPEGTRAAAVLESGGYAEYAVAETGMIVAVPGSQCSSPGSRVRARSWAPPAATRSARSSCL